MDFFPVLKCVAANHVWRDYNTEQNVLQVLFLYYFADILFYLKYTGGERNVDERRYTGDCRIAGAH